MNQKLIQQYGPEILCYRIRTARQKKRLRYKDFDKQLIGFYKKERELLQQQRNLGWEPLKPPFQRGWKRFFVLRADVALSRDALFFDNILAKINTKDWSHRKDFMIKTRKYGSKKYTVKEQRLLEPFPYFFEKLDFSPEEKKYFDLVYTIPDRQGRVTARYVFREPWRFVLQVQPNIIDKRMKTDPEQDAALSRIDNYLERNGYRFRQSKILNGSLRWRYWKSGDGPIPGKTDVFKNKSFAWLIDHITSK